MLMFEFLIVLIPFIAYTMVSGACSIIYCDYDYNKYNKCVSALSILVELVIAFVFFILTLAGAFEFSRTLSQTVNITNKIIIPISIVAIIFFRNIFKCKRRSYDEEMASNILVLILIFIAFSAMVVLF